MNPSKRTTFVVHNYATFMAGLNNLKVKVIKEFKELIRQMLDFLVGYFIGKQSTKYWIMCEEDLNAICLAVV